MTNTAWACCASSRPNRKRTSRENAYGTVLRVTEWVRFRVLVKRDAAVAAEVAAAHAAHTARCEYRPERGWINAGKPGSLRSERAQAAAAEKARRIAEGAWAFSRANLVRVRTEGPVQWLGLVLTMMRLPAKTSSPSARW